MVFISVDWFTFFGEVEEVEAWSLGCVFLHFNSYNLLYGFTYVATFSYKTMQKYIFRSLKQLILLYFFYY